MKKAQTISSVSGFSRLRTAQFQLFLLAAVVWLDPGLFRAQAQAVDPPVEIAQEEQLSESPTQAISETAESETAIVSLETAESDSASYEEQDLAAQRGMNAAAQRTALYALLQTILIGIGTVAIIWTLFLSRQANSTALKAVSDAARIGKAQVRGYLSCIRGEYVAGSEKLYVDVVVRNFGQSPVKNSNCSAALKLLKSDEWDSKEAFSTKSFLRDLIPPHEISSGVISASGEYSFLFSWPIIQPAFSDSILNGRLDFEVSGEIVWEDVFDGVHKVDYRITMHYDAELAIVEVDDELTGQMYNVESFEVPPDWIDD